MKETDSAIITSDIHFMRINNKMFEFNILRKFLIFFRYA